MTRKQLRSVLESFKIDPSFIIIVSGKESGTIRCKDKKTKKESVALLKENGFRICRIRDSMDVYNNSLCIDFTIPEKYHVKKEKTYFDILGDLESSITRTHQSFNQLSSD